MTQMTESVDYPELLSDIAQQIEVCLVKKKLDTEEARRIGREIAEHVRGHFAGELIYIPKGRKFEASQLHQAIWDKFNGDNIAELVTEFKMAEPSIYRVLKFMRKHHTAKRQLSIF